MSNYTTQMDAARKGIVTPEIEKVAKKEKMDVDKLMELVASGKVAIPANKHHKSLDAEGHERCKAWSRGYHGSFKPWQHTAIQTEAYKRMSCNDRNSACL